MSEARTVMETVPSLTVPIEHDLIHEDGIYFGLPDTEYHAALALSASGIKNMRVSTLDWWARSPLNPDYEDEDSAAKTVGRAYHKRILEGREAFERCYAAAIDPADHPKALRTADDIKTELRARELPVNGTKDKLIERLLADDPNARSRIWDCLVADHREKYPGREFLTADLIRKIEVAAAMIECHPTLKKAFSGGYPEVSIFYRDRESNVPVKCRLDYLKPRAIVDLKTVEDSIGLPLKKAFARSVASYKLHVQAALYLDAANEARRFIAEGKVFGDVDKGFLNALAASDGRTFMWVAQRKGIAPLAQGFIIPPGITLDLGRHEIDQAKADFMRSWHAFGPDTPWIPGDDIETYDSTDFPAWIGD